MLDIHFIFHFDYTLQSKLRKENTCLWFASFRSTLVDKVSKKQCSCRQVFCPKSGVNQLQNEEQNQSCFFNHRNKQFRKTQTTVSVFFGLVTESHKLNQRELNQQQWCRQNWKEEPLKDVNKETVHTMGTKDHCTYTQYDLQYAF